MLVRALCEKALECARSKRLDIATRRYVFRYDEAFGHVREALRQKHDPRAIAYFEELIDRFIDEIVEDPGRAVERRFLPDSQLAEGIRESLGKPPSEAALRDMPERLLLEIKRKQGTLRRVGEQRFHQGHIQTVAAPDGEGGYFVDTVGTPGRWEVRVAAGGQNGTAAAAVTRLLDALCDIAFGGTIPQGVGRLERGPTGEDDQVVVVESVEDADAYVEEGAAFYRPSDLAFSGDIAVELLAGGRQRLYVANRLLALSRARLRGRLRDAFPSLVPASPSAVERRSLPLRTTGDPSDETPPGVVMLDFAGTSGPYLVGHALEMQGIPTQVVKPGGRIALEQPGVFCISLATQPPGAAEVGDQIRALREVIDEHFPGAFVIVGGPSAKHAKSVITLFPEINILLRGEGEEVLPEVLRIIGGTKTTDGLSGEQIAELKKIDGLFLHTPGFYMFNNLHKVNTLQDFDVPVVFHYGTYSLYGGGEPVAAGTVISPDIARGCPFRCSFCSMAMGCNQRYVDLGKLQNYVLGTLATEIALPRGTGDALAAALRKAPPVAGDARDEWFPADTYVFSKEQLAEVVRVLDRDLSEDLSAKGLMARGTRLLTGGAAAESSCLPKCVTRAQVNEAIVLMRQRWMAVLMDNGEDLYDHGLDHKLEIILEDDNTLCNRGYVETFCRWVIDSGLQNYLRFGGGQTSVTSFLKGGNPDEDFIRLLREAGCCEVEMGVDGLANNILRQNDKRGYRLGDAIRVIKTLTKWGINGASNRLYSAPYASRIDIVESLLLGAMAPLGGHSLGGAFIIAVPGSQYTNELAVNYPERAANRTDFERTYGGEYAHAWARFPEYVPLEHHLYPFAPDASRLTERFASVIKIERVDKHIYDAERETGEMTHELGILDKLEAEGLRDEIDEVIRRWQAADQEDPELKALGSIIRLSRDKGKDDFSTFRRLLAWTYSPETPAAFSDILDAMAEGE